MTNTKARHLEILEAAKAALVENDVDITRPVNILPIAKIVAQQTDCHITTAKNNVAKAIRIARGELVAQWGGNRQPK